MRGTYVRYGEGDHLCNRDQVAAIYRDAAASTTDTKVLRGLDMSVFDMNTVHDYRNYFGRDHNISRSAQLVRNDNEIPLVLWFSPVYKARHPEVVARAQAACHRPMVNDDVSNMLLDLGGIDTRYYNASRNVLDARGFKPVRRIVYDHYDYDKLVREAARYQSTTK